VPLGHGAYKVYQEERDGLVRLEPQGRLEYSVLLELPVRLEVRDSRAQLEQRDLLAPGAETDSPVQRGQLVSLAVLEIRELLAVLVQLVHPVLLVLVDILEHLDQLVQLAEVEQRVYLVPLDKVVPLDSPVLLDVVEPQGV